MGGRAVDGGTGGDETHAPCPRPPLVCRGAGRCKPRPSPASRWPQPAQSSVQEDIEARALKLQEQKAAEKEAAKAAKAEKAADKTEVTSEA